jgi:hypothetical protein
MKMSQLKIEIMRLVYIIKCLINGSTFYKVGIAHDAERRIRELQTGNPVRLELVRTFECDNARRVENDTHRALFMHRGVGEWFSCDLESIEKIIGLAIEKKTTGRMRKRYGERPAPVRTTMAFFSDDLDR